jgi:hypothetical protein
VTSRPTIQPDGAPSVTAGFFGFSIASTIAIGSLLLADAQRRGRMVTRITGEP